MRGIFDDGAERGMALLRLPVQYHGQAHLGGPDPATIAEVRIGQRNLAADLGPHAATNTGLQGRYVAPMHADTQPLSNMNVDIGRQNWHVPDLAAAGGWSTARPNPFAGEPIEGGI